VLFQEKGQTLSKKYHIKDKRILNDPKKKKNDRMVNTEKWMKENYQPEGKNPQRETQKCDETTKTSFIIYCFIFQVFKTNSSYKKSRASYSPMFLHDNFHFYFLITFPQISKLSIIKYYF